MELLILGEAGRGDFFAHKFGQFIQWQIEQVPLEGDVVL